MKKLILFLALVLFPSVASAQYGMVPFEYGPVFPPNCIHAYNPAFVYYPSNTMYLNISVYDYNYMRFAPPYRPYRPIRIDPVVW